MSRSRVGPILTLVVSDSIGKSKFAEMIGEFIDFAVGCRC